MSKAIAMVGLCVFAMFKAQAEGVPSIYTEQDKLIHGSDAIATLGAGLFGEKVNLYNGTLEFAQTDVSLPGNNTLNVAVGRRLVPTSDQARV